MKAVGLIVEYNPFHNGHLYHLTQSKLQTEADVTIAVMSGSFLQRGEPAIVNKWARTEMALRGGVDLVIELPYIYSTQHAQHFAEGAVTILEALQCDYFCFGSENGSISMFVDKWREMTENEALLNEQIRTYSKQGHSYPKAVSLALKALNLSKENDIDLTKPNNILGYQYVRAAMVNQFHIKPALITRMGANYHDTQLPAGQIASATSIRQALSQENKDIKPFMPVSTYNILQDYYRTYRTLHQWEQYYPLLQYQLLSSSPEELEQIYEVEEGIQHRLKEAALLSSSFEQFIMKVKTKRYTLTRLQRMCVHILTNSKKEKIKSLINYPSYIRILGFNEKGRHYLNKNKKSFGLPLISKVSSAEHPALALDIQAATIHALAVPVPHQNELIQREYKQVIMV